MELLLTLSGGLGAALVLGYLAHRLGLSPIVGYLMAGIAVGPSTPGFTANADIAGQLAELGVMLLMFGVGLHFDIHELSRVKSVAIPGALIQCSITFAFGWTLAFLAGWSPGAAFVFGIAIAFASTVVVTRVLADVNELQSQAGSIAIGWLIVQDVLAVLALVLLPSFGGGRALNVFEIAWVLGFAAIKMGVVALSVIMIGGKVIPNVLRHVAATKSRELFTLTILVLVLGIALGASELFGVSMALGAFLAGVVVGQSEFSLRAATEALPMKDAFAVLFFVSVGMLFDPSVFVDSPWVLASTLMIVMVITPSVTLAIIASLGYPLDLGLKVATSLAQIGEFSFIIATLAREMDLIPVSVMHVLVTVSLVSISAAPFLQSLVPACRARFGRWRFGPALLAMRKPFSMIPIASGLDELPGIDPAHHAVIIGYGPVGRTVARLLAENGVSPSIVEMNHESLATIRAEGFRAVLGDATHASTLKSAGVDQSASLILSASTIQGAKEVIRVAREMNPKVQVIIRANYLREQSDLLRSGADQVFAGEGEVAMALVEYILRDLGATADQIDRERDRVRTEMSVSTGAVSVNSRPTSDRR